MARGASGRRLLAVAASSAIGPFVPLCETPEATALGKQHGMSKKLHKAWQFACKARKGAHSMAPLPCKATRRIAVGRMQEQWVAGNRNNATSGCISAMPHVALERAAAPVRRPGRKSSVRSRYSMTCARAGGQPASHFCNVLAAPLRTFGEISAPFKQPRMHNCVMKPYTAKMRKGNSIASIKALWN